MNAPNFSSILERSASDVERPKPLPSGTYICMVQGMPRFDKSTKKGTDYVEFSLRVTDVYRNDEGESDVDDDALEEYGGITEKSRLRATFYITEDAVWRLKKFLTDCGIDQEGKSLAMMIHDAPNQTLLVHVGHRAAEDGEGVFAEIKKTAKYE